MGNPMNEAKLTAEDKFAEFIALAF